MTGAKPVPPGEAAAPPALVVEHLSKRFGATLALDDVSLRASGEIYGLLGSNGAGKSTLLRCVLGLVPPGGGTIHVCGHNVTSHPIEVKRLTGYLPEDLKLYGRLTGWEFLRFIAGLKQIDADEMIERDLRHFGLWPRRNDFIDEYSLGMKKKIGLIAAWSGDPWLLLLDEPLNGLDAESMRRVRLRLEEMLRRGRTIILSSHVMAFVERVCQRVGILRQGRLILEGTPPDIRRASGLGGAAFDDVFLHFASTEAETNVSAEF